MIKSESIKGKPEWKQTQAVRGGWEEWGRGSSRGPHDTPEEGLSFEGWGALTPPSVDFLSPRINAPILPCRPECARGLPRLHVPGCNPFS